ncbi:MAG TPA: HD domain-containing phosphohydrolase, partial [Dehalococcoidia bacterium]|nr:HD domain-containing phosphohydrolase [Dehalococcoidia bacterium]
FLTVKDESEDRLAALSAGAYDYVTKPFSPAEIMSRIEAHFRRSRKDRESNPLTGLPGGPQVSPELNARIAQGQPFALLYADLDSFKAFNDYYGFIRGDQAIVLLARVLEEAVQLLGNADDFVGHIGGDDFAVITTPDKARAICNRVIGDFDQRIAALYDEEDLRRGYIQCEDRMGNLMRYPVTTLSIGGVTNERRRIESYLRASEIAAEVRRHAKSIPGSSYYFDQRENGFAVKGQRPFKSARVLSEMEPSLRGRAGDFVSLIAHELRTPVTAMKTSLEGLMRSIQEDLEPQQRDLLDLAYRRAKRLASAVSDLVTYDRLERGELDLDARAVDLSDLTEQVLEEVRWSAEEKSIPIHVEGLPLSPQVLLDGDNLARALRHLLDNAVKYTPPGGTVSVRFSSDESSIRIEVRDTGAGIPQRELAAIFRSFRQLQSPSTRREPGLGLGLSLARKLVQAMGGYMEVESHEGEGSTFAMVLPKSWRSNSLRIRTLQEAMACSLDSVHSGLRALVSAPLDQKVPVPGADGSAGLVSGIQEIEVLANRAILLAEQSSRRCEKNEERVRLMRADLVMAVESLVAAIEKQRPFSLGVSRRVASHALGLARLIGLPKKEQDALYCAALLHDLGMVAVAPELLRKNGPPTEEEWEAIRSHPKLGAEAVSHVRELAPAVPLILAHQERYDGQGYPQGLKGWNIPRGARVLAVAVAYDAMTSNRPHRPALNPEAAMQRIAAEAGKSFDPQVVNAFVSLWQSGEVQAS